MKHLQCKDFRTDYLKKKIKVHSLCSNLIRFELKAKVGIGSKCFDSYLRVYIFSFIVGKICIDDKKANNTNINNLQE